MSLNLDDEYKRLLKVEEKLDKFLKQKDNKLIHMELLHQYNDIKDATQIIINYIANIEDTTITKVHERLQLKDWKKTQNLCWNVLFIWRQIQLYNIIHQVFIWRLQT